MIYIYYVSGTRPQTGPNKTLKNNSSSKHINLAALACWEDRLSSKEAYPLVGLSLTMADNGQTAFPPSKSIHPSLLGSKHERNWCKQKNVVTKEHSCTRTHTHTHTLSHTHTLTHTHTHQPFSLASQEKGANKNWVCPVFSLKWVFIFQFP
jgi:hypothetical protein